MNDKKSRIKKTVKKLVIVVVTLFVAFVIFCIAITANYDKIEKWVNENAPDETTPISTTVIETTTKLETTTNTTTIKPTTTTEVITTTTRTPTKYAYDNLQKVFLDITPNTTENDVQKYIKTYSLCNSKKEYKGSKSVCYKLAYNEQVALQSHADTGDYIEITFGTNGKLKYAEYFNTNAFHKDCIGKALLYISGTYYDFREDGMDGDYSGYYGEKYDFKNDNGVVIKYTNGNSTETDYYKFNSAESVIQCIIDNIE